MTRRIGEQLRCTRPLAQGSAHVRCALGTDHEGVSTDEHPPSAVVLRVDREHPGRTDDDVIDVGSGSADRNSVQDGEIWAEQFEFDSDASLAAHALEPAARGWGERVDAPETLGSRPRRVAALNLQALPHDGMTRSASAERDRFTLIRRLLSTELGCRSLSAPSDCTSRPTCALPHVPSLAGAVRRCYPSFGSQHNEVLTARGFRPLVPQPQRAQLPDVTSGVHREQLRLASRLRKDLAPL